MKISAYINSVALMLSLTVPLLGLAQQTNSVKMDSIKRVSEQRMNMRKDSFKRIATQRDLLRRDSIKKDTVSNTPAKSPFLVVYSAPRPTSANAQQLSVQATRFRHIHFLNFLLKGSFAAPVKVGYQGKLYMAFDDNSTLLLNTTGSALSHSNGMKNSSDLEVHYSIRQQDFATLLNKKVTALKMDYDGGIFTFAITTEGALKIKQACLLTK